MPQVPNEQMPAMIAEVVNRTSNIDSLMVVEKYLYRVDLIGAEAVELGRAIAWVKGVLEGERTRVKELKAQLPENNTEIKIGPEQPEEPQDAEESDPTAEPSDQAKTGITVSGVELQKGEPVLGAVC